MKTFRLFGVFIPVLATCVACSTPHNNSYTQHINTLNHSPFKESNFTYHFSGSQNVTLLGLYEGDNDANSGPVLYAGGAGIAGLVIQMGAHSAIINSNRRSKLEQEQQKANAAIAPLIEIAGRISLQDLDTSRRYSEDTTGSQTLSIQPTFYANASMSHIVLKAIAHVPAQSMDSNTRYVYKNLIQVYSQELSDSTLQAILNGDEKRLSTILSPMLTTAVDLAKGDVTGQFTTSGDQQTYLAEMGNTKKVFRGVLVKQSCQYQIVRDIHRWIVAIPETENACANSGNKIALNP